MPTLKTGTLKSGTLKSGTLIGEGPAGAVAVDYVLPLIVKRNSATILIQGADIVAADSGTNKSVFGVDTPVGCTAAKNGANVDFTPQQGYHGYASFRYQLTADEGTDYGQVFIYVKAGVSAMSSVGMGVM